MSLTRDDWAKMWESIKSIELQAKLIKKPLPSCSEIILKRVKEIKDQIQSVVGQME